MSWVLMAAGFVLVFEGLVFALAPSRLEDLLRTLSTIPVDVRRLLGLGALAVGVMLLWIARSIGSV
jgi:uncharacterized protein YjeT (DUF2065 family)